MVRLSNTALGYRAAAAGPLPGREPRRLPGRRLQAAKAELESRGVRFYSGVNVVDEGVLAGWRWVYFEDPDGYPLELVENAYERPGGHDAGIAKYLEVRHARPAVP